ncbi:MAG: PAS domain-containing protein [Burkholderiaceae bacterium]
MSAAGAPPATSIDASYYDTDKILRQAAATFFDHLSEMCEGILLVDSEARLVWINDRYERYLGTLGFTSPEEVLGRPIEEVVPNTMMRSVVETGRPILIDVIENPTGAFVVSRIPLHDDDGRVIGAVGMILYLRPDRFAQTHPRPALAPADRACRGPPAARPPATHPLYVLELRRQQPGGAERQEPSPARRGAQYHGPAGG